MLTDIMLTEMSAHYPEFLISCYTLSLSFLLLERHKYFDFFGGNLLSLARVTFTFSFSIPSYSLSRSNLLLEKHKYFDVPADRC